MIVGFTGSRAGLTPAQRTRIKAILRRATEAHHGDCVGADEQFHQLCIEAGVPVVLHPPTNESRRAFCKGAKRTTPPREYLVRNKDIVESCELLIATPKEHVEPEPARGQGTWSTVRFARKVGAKFEVIWPSNYDLGNR